MTELQIILAIVAFIVTFNVVWLVVWMRLIAQSRSLEQPFRERTEKKRKERT